MTKDSLSILYEVAGRAAYAHVAGKGLPVHMREDLTQEGVLWLLEHPQRVRHARLSDGTLYGSALVSEIRKHYVSSGADRHQGNEAFVDTEWTPRMVETVFPAVYDPEYKPFREGTEPGERFAKRDPSEANTWLALIADVSSAVDALGKSSDAVRFIYRHAVLHESYLAIAQVEGVSDWTARQRVVQGLQWMSDWLNGERAEFEDPADEPE